MNPSPSADARPLPAGCLSDTDLDRLVNGEASVSAAAARHVEECAACRARLEALAGTGALGLSGLAASDAVPGPLADAMAVLREHPPGPASGCLENPMGFEAVPLDPRVRPEALGSFAGYDILELVASGGMGVVFKGYDRSLQRVVAIKVLAPGLAASAVARVRFLREARAAAAVSHEHVVAIHAVGEEKGLPYLVMQFVAGRSLQARLEATGPLTPQEVLRVGSQAAYGLAAAHSQGLIHRDVKPGNILLENSVERVKLTDFGLARAADATDVTRPGVVAGTPEFMAPEQARGERLDHRADLFALGTVLYTVATGNSPFRADSTPATLRRVCEDRPKPVHEVDPRHPRWLGEIIERLMAKRPEDRYPDARAVALALEEGLARVQRGSSPGTALRLGDRPGPMPPRPMRGRAAAIGVGVGLVALLAVLVWGVLDRRSVGPDASFRIVRTNGITEVFTNWTETLGAMRSGDVLELAWDGPRVVAPVESTGRVLHLRAAEGRVPVVVHASRIRPWLMTDADLRIEGIEFRSAGVGAGGEPVPRPGMGNRQAMEAARRVLDRGRTHEPGNQVLVSRGGNLTLVNCRFVTSSTVDEVEVPILVQECPSASLVNCELLHPGGPAIAWKASGGSRLGLSNCVLMARSAFFFVSSGTTVAEFDLDHCTFVGSFLIASLSGGESLRGHGSGNVLSLRRPWVGSPGLSPPTRQRWQGRGNLYDRAGVETGLQIPSTDQGSVFLDLGLDTRLREKVNSAMRVTPADFALTPDQQARFGGPAGVRVEWVGPGEAWQRWKAKAAGSGP